jgi:branched-chain amino acid transport system substrate-binding protein
MPRRPTVRRRTAAAFIAAILACAPGPMRAAEPEPIRIGFGEAQTGALAAIGKSGILAMQIWADKINAAGGLLGRPVTLVTYDTQSNPANVPGIYVKLLDVDHVDVILSSYATNMAAPAMPIVIAHNKLFLTLFALAVNSEFHYPRAFAMIATGPDPKRAFSKGFFDVAMSMDPKPQTLAILGADAEFARNATDGARLNAKEAGLRIVYDGSYPPTTTDYAPVVRAVRATSPDVIYVASYPTDTVGILRSASEMNLKARLFGGSMVGLATSVMKTQLGPLLNGIILGEQWVPAPKLLYPGVTDFLQVYRSKAAAAGVDPLGIFLPPFAYARMQVLEQAVTATGALDDAKLADYIHTHAFNTVVGTINYGKDGEWAESRLIWTQFQGIKNNDLTQFLDTSTEVVLLPEIARSGALITPFQAGAP